MGLVIAGTALAVVGTVVLVLAFLGIVGVLAAGAVVATLVVALTALAVRRARATELEMTGRESLD